MDIDNSKIYPALYHAADSASLKGQKEYIGWFQFQLWVLGTASFVGLFQTDNTSYGKIIAAISLILFVIGSFVSFYIQNSKNDSNWYYGRAIAESLKTLSWRFIIGGEPFVYEQNNVNQVERQFLDSLNRILETNRDFLTISSDSNEQITIEMRKIRAMPLRERKVFYTLNRINEQLKWYRSKSDINEKQKRKYSILIISINLIALLYSVALLIDNNLFNLTPFLITLASVFISWQQVKNFGELSQAYAITAHEISMISSQLEFVTTEEEFAIFIGDSENAFSREHTLWLARRDAYYLTKTRK